MNVLLLSSRFPWPAFTGDRVRATIWLAALRDANVALVAPDGVVPSGVRVRFHPAARSFANGAAGALRQLRAGAMTALLAASYDWRDAIARATRDAGPFDATIVLLSRLDPWVRNDLPRGLRVLDAIDSLSRSSEERAREAAPLVRPLWRAESRRIAQAERDAAGAYDRVLVVSEEEAEELHATAIPNGIELRPLTDAPRAYDFGFWGQLGYFANADAVSWLLDEIWPLIREQRPDATLLIAGANAPRALLARDGVDGVRVHSPVDDIALTARSIDIALMPMRYGTGQMNKVLEAAEAGCAIVATRHALRGFAPLAAHASLANGARELAQLAVALASDRTRRASAARELRAITEKTYAREQTLARLAAVVRAEVAA